MRVALVGPDDFRAMPWRNGLGTTIEMAREDESTGAMLWRVSAADVVEAGAFSPFPGIDRILTLIEGPGFDLDFSGHGRVAPVELLQPVRFSGDWTTRAEAVRGPSRDLNVMTARGKASAQVHVHRDAASSVPLGDRSLFFCLAGHPILTVADAEYPLGLGRLAVICGGAERVGALSAGATVVQIDITFSAAPAGHARNGPLLFL
ncbi:HutD family protein [Devosia sp.]|uniref:HutD/Ves family protein n=1 Tax=Devosia sp. TaxID=1871048 RepID=UPI00292CF969|nr:HutD family protein [Devosia sp.]